MEFVKTGEKEDSIRLSDGKNSAWFLILDAVSYKGQEYFALLEENDDTPLILMSKEDNGKELFCTVDDENTFDEVSSALEKAMDED